jgi:OmpA-OmpF porin, OOP family
VEIQGHTDNIGTRNYNIRLSLARAQAVCDYLTAKGIAKDRLIIKGFGPDRPIAKNDTSEGRGQNRRITFMRIK